MEKYFDQNIDVKLAKKVRRLQVYSIELQYPKLDRKTPHLRTYADSIHANNKSLSTQLGFIICLCDANGNAAMKSY